MRADFIDLLFLIIALVAMFLADTFERLFIGFLSHEPARGFITFGVPVILGTSNLRTLFHGTFSVAQSGVLSHLWFTPSP